MAGICLIVNIHGLVQGVWYRESTKNKALELGVAGWVKNLADGSVEACMQGDEEAVRGLLAWCHEGPPMARVERVETWECPPGGERHADFRVLR
ncbi:MAG: acylphosphatase [Magnetococcales bacterium]|nr:acylphosphatase [Magnetococcales bacterium]